MFKEGKQKVLINEEDIKKRCKEYFRTLFNEEISGVNKNEVKWNEGLRN